MPSLLLAWLSAAAFAASLGFFLYSYLVVFARPAAGSAETLRNVLAPLGLNLALFTIFALHHSVFARTGFKALVHRVVSPASERAVYSLIASLLFVLVCWAWQPVPGTGWVLPGVWQWAGYALVVAGLGITIDSARTLDVLDLAGVRQVQRARTDAPPRRPAPLQTTGVYGLVRHPVYFGWCLFVFGMPHMTLTRLTFAVVSTLYLVVAIPFEERSLTETFGPDYASYQRKVRWRMLPGIY